MKSSTANTATAPKSAHSRSRKTIPAGSPASPDIGAFRARHLALSGRRMTTDFGPATVTVDEAESPLARLAKRRGCVGRALIAAHHLMAGKRLRYGFTRAHLMPRTNSNWESPMASGRSDGDVIGQSTDVMIASSQRVNQALDAVGPEFSGLLLDVCCFLKGLEDIERERCWPIRSAKVVLQLGLDRLARHYGYAAQAQGRNEVPIRTWLAEGAGFVVES
jgi:hypothetical protein